MGLAFEKPAEGRLRRWEEHQAHSLACGSSDTQEMPSTRGIGTLLEHPRQLPWIQTFWKVSRASQHCRIPSSDNSVPIIVPKPSHLCPPGKLGEQFLVIQCRKIGGGLVWLGASNIGAGADS